MLLNRSFFIKRALIIGSEGNIGKPLKKYLLDNKYQIHEIDIRPAWRDGYSVADINHTVDLLPGFLDFRPDVVFLLSAMVSRVTCEQAGGLAIATNCSGVQSVLELTKRVGAKLIFFSTSEVYGPDVPTMSEDIDDPRPNNRYGLSKLLGEKLVEYEVKQYGLEAVTLRPFMIYDENEDLGDHRSAMVRFATNLALGKGVEVHQGAKRGWLHSSDAVEAIERAVQIDGYHKINIGHPDIRDIHELAEMIRVRLNASADLVKEVKFPGRMTPVKQPDLTRQAELLGIEPRIDLETGVAKVCDRIVERLKQEGSLPR